MSKGDLLFYDAYEEFYNIVEKNNVFSKYCEEVFGIDFSQDGFSDINQVNDLITIANIDRNNHVLDIGCGNGKMIEYISEKTSAIGYGFDYSKNAIDYAFARTSNKRDNLFFEVGLIGKIQYEANMFDIILSVDTMYFADNMEEFLKQVYCWLKPKGVFMAFYGEGHLKNKTKDKDNTELARALKKLDFGYEVIDYTKNHYDLMRHKRRVANEMKEEFFKNNMDVYFDCAIDQSIDIKMNFEEFEKIYNRYLYIVRK